MGFLLSASLALLNSNALFPGEDCGAAKRALFYGQRIEGWVLWKRITVGLTDGKVNRILGAPPIRGCSASHVADYYVWQGLSVYYDWPEIDPLRVTRVHWQWQWYR